MTTDLQARLDAVPIFNRLQAMGILPDNALPWMLDSQDFYNALGAVLSKLDAAEAQVKALTAEHAALLIKVRDALVSEDAAEAFHLVYMFAVGVTPDPFKPWEELEARAALKLGGE